jgi:hypothetical protein
MDSKRLEEYCRLGEQADTDLRRGRPTEALKTYNEIVSRLEKTGDVDSYLFAKVTLGVLRCYVKQGDFKNAFQIWNAGIDDGTYGVGIDALESAQTTVQDMITYDMLCGFLHTLAVANKVDAARAVNQYLSRVCEHAVESNDHIVLQQALNNWKHHLRDVFKGSIPHEFAVSLIHFEKVYGQAVKPSNIDFPMPAPWEKPSDFREMSRVVQENDVAHRPKASRRNRAV